MNPLRETMASLRRRPVRVRLAIFSGVLTAVILIAFAAVVGRLVSNRLQADFKDQIRDTAAKLSVSVQVFETSDGRFTYRFPNLEQLAIADDAAIRIVDQAGRVLQSSGAEASVLGPPSLDEDLRSVGNLQVVDALVRSTPPSLTTGPLYIQYARSPEDVDKTIDRLWLFLGGGVVIGTLLAGFAGMTVANRAMRPIADLTGTARTIARTRDPSLRIPAPENEDEVAELARTLDEMLRELDAARAETETTIQRQREFVADASHELRTPLTSILANLELLEAALEPDDDGDGDELAATRSALRSSRRMSRLVGDLLILARADAGRRGEPVPCDLAQIASEAVEEVDPVAEGHTFTTDLDGEAPVVGNPDELHRMVLNLLENAIRHTPAGTNVDLSIDRDGERVRLVVADDGPGLPEGMEDKVFGRFVRGAGPADSHAANGEGTGLGLAIVRAVAGAHGGEVSAGGNEAGGASFSVALPLAAVSGEVEPAPATQD